MSAKKTRPERKGAEDQSAEDVRSDAMAEVPEDKTSGTADSAPDATAAAKPVSEASEIDASQDARQPDPETDTSDPDGTADAGDAAARGEDPGPAGTSPAERAEPEDKTPQPGDAEHDLAAPDQSSSAAPDPEGRDAAEADDRTRDDDAVADATDSEAEPIPQAAPPPERVVERVVEKRSGFFPALMGGIIAAGLGLAAGSSDILAPYLPASLQREPASAVSPADLQRLEAEIAALAARPDAPAPADVDLSGIEAQLAALAARQDDRAQAADADAEAIAGRLAALAATDTAIAQRLDALESRVTALAEAPAEVGLPADALEPYEAELAAVREALTQQRADVEAMVAEAARLEAEAEESARRARAQAAATRLIASVDAGQAFSDELDELQGLGVPAPQPLADAADGVDTLAALQVEFPALARSALAAARAAAGDDGGLSGFLQRQLGARSVTPREGDDADAILSRAEAALMRADLRASLGELDSLPEAARVPLAAWMQRAAARLSATEAAETLARSVDGTQQEGN